MQQGFDFGTGARWVAGVDEVGRGPLVGAVIAAAVILDPTRPVSGLTDSKKLSPQKRESLAVLIREQAIAWAIGRADPHEIDEINILQASLLAMRRAVKALSVVPDHVLVDGNRLPVLPMSARAIVKGDLTEPAISAASIIAKVTRDEEMLLLDARYPGYGIAQHKGYPTAEHLDALMRLGPTPEHRLSFSPVRNARHARSS